MNPPSASMTASIRDQNRGHAGTKWSLFILGIAWTIVSFHEAMVFSEYWLVFLFTTQNVSMGIKSIEFGNYNFDVIWSYCLTTILLLCGLCVRRCRVLLKHVFHSTAHFIYPVLKNCPRHLNVSNNIHSMMMRKDVRWHDITFVIHHS